MNQLQFKRIVDYACNDFEQERKIKVLQSGRHALVEPAIPHLGTVTRELNEGKITEAFLAGGVDVVLNNAARDPEVHRRGAIDDQAVERSIAFYCPYLFWC